MKLDNIPDGFDLEIEVKSPPAIPHQSNDYDCAVFMLQFMKYTTLEKPFNFSCLDVLNLREEMKQEILHHEIRDI